LLSSPVTIPFCSFYMSFPLQIFPFLGASACAVLFFFPFPLEVPPRCPGTRKFWAPGLPSGILTPTLSTRDRQFSMNRHFTLVGSRYPTPRNPGLSLVVRPTLLVFLSLFGGSGTYYVFQGKKFFWFRCCPAPFRGQKDFPFSGFLGF